MTVPMVQWFLVKKQNILFLFNTDLLRLMEVHRTLVYFRADFSLFTVNPTLLNVFTTYTYTKEQYAVFIYKKQQHWISESSSDSCRKDFM